MSWGKKEGLESQIVVTAHAHTLSVQVCHHTGAEQSYHFKDACLHLSSPQKVMEDKGEVY